MHLPPVLSVLILLTAALGLVFLAQRLRLPSLSAYLLIGMALGPHGLKLLAETEEVETLAEFGVAFLMFSIGLEFSLNKLKAMRGLVFGFGGGQVALTATATTLVALFGYGQRWETGLVVGVSVAMSSTAIVARLLSERFELHSRSGRQTMGVLLFQDLAVVPCLILFPALARPGESLWQAMALAALQTGVVLAVLIGLGRRPLAALLRSIAHRRSEELFVLATLWIVVALGYATYAAGLSLALGAFIGGMLISETIYRHQVEADVRPFRDILLGLFFITIGMLLDLAYVLTHLPLLGLAVALLIGGKALVVLILTRIVRSSWEVSLRTTAQLAQAGEFGLVLIQLGYELKLLSEDVFQVTLAAMLFSMFLAPFLIERAARWSGQWARGDWAHQAKAIHDIATSAFALEQHVIVCGYGRTGRNVVQFLAEAAIPCLALDLNPAHIKAATGVVFGNGERPEVLKAAGISRARGVVIAFHDLKGAERIVRLVRHDHPTLPIIVRAGDDAAVARLKAAGATEVIPEVVEGSLMIAAEALIQFGVAVDVAMARVRAARSARYASLRGAARPGT